MGGATRFMALLTTPLPQLRPSFILLRRISSISVAPRRILTLSSPSKTQTPIPLLVNCLHSQSTNSSYAIQSSAAQHHPWTEWINFLNILSNGQGLSALEEQGITPGDEFVVYEELSGDFVRASSACIAFARARPNLLRLLSRKDIELVVANGTPFLFKSALDTARRMRAFLGTDGNVSEVDKANTIDLMKYILSYTSNPTDSPERKGLYSRELVDSSIRKLLHEMCTVCSGAPTGYMPASRQSQMSFGHNIEMKRGDWICQKCNFMNFAKNVKCLECEETRPKKQLTGGEWECPQCNFFNYGRNTVCLRCDCRRPGSPLLNNSNNSKFNSGYNGEHSNEGKAQQWFSKISQLNRVDDDTNTSAVLDKENKQEHFKKMSEFQKKDTSFTSPKYKRQVTNDQTDTADFVPFVPFPPGYFSKKEGTNQPSHVKPSVPESSRGNPGGNVGPTESKWSGKSLEGSGEKEGDPLDMSEEAKAERWFKRVAQIKDISELSQIPDEDFPSIMPMRKGVNRFVVSKRKTPLERRLTSQQHRRNLPVVSSDSVED